MFVIRTIITWSRPDLEIPISEAVKGPIAAKEEVLGDEREVFDGQLQVQDEGVADLFFEVEKEPLVEVIKEEL